MLEGGLDSGRVKRDSCFAVDSPQALRPGFCDVHPPFLTMVKLVGSYVLPWSVQVSGTMQSAPGPEILAAYTARSTEIQPSLGRPLASGANGTAVVDLVAPGTMFGERLLMFDARAARNFRVGGMRVRGMLDLYNVLNANTVLIMSNTYRPGMATTVERYGRSLIEVRLQYGFLREVRRPSTKDPIAHWVDRRCLVRSSYVHGPRDSTSRCLEGSYHDRVSC